MRLAHLFALPGGFDGHALSAQPVARTETAQSRMRGNAKGPRYTRPFSQLFGPATLGAAATAPSRRRQASWF
ncbi:hypothetical protein GCM10011505_19490 [Tistrella bauzanensis]|uniref:Uncharacterized protein n=1 Tax=Tistrella bauzanensis TaxID=657419 RepID=A0ABQ1IFK2_9PROT|nr:hypothetical protein [Tistrella bauzanensis]GGB38047.1 hypothetical protein GCM10011505_19490 [Tistrella bauzanensis]